MYVVLDEHGKFVAVVQAADLEPILARTGRAAARVTPPVPHDHDQTVSQVPRPLGSSRPAAAPKPKPGQKVAFRIRHLSTGKFLATGLKLDTKQPPNFWATEGNAKQAIAAAVNRGLGARTEYEIVPTMIDE
jgi:hypothetical protein